MLASGNQSKGLHHDLGEVIGDPVITDAIRDRLEHAALTISITGESYSGVKARRLAARTEALREDTRLVPAIYEQAVLQMA